ncbi:SAM-dependent methyltransferase [Psychromonas sp. psych-6C06]|uniref:tRNA (adenine(22)-N(1))-methyltransferase n=1 Tax=Psychromonas sp. psych-6C06 TaxID=2058089 RepID=UPI000C34E0C4|nr:tRNA (adenine(22)-N(1))-methyltransferase TrmK [Psychromonas sp. psych-6C06]PKF62172.1 SAM-dependent methyltransferase [Psychromonas sp. psych-6C06]
MIELSKVKLGKRLAAIEASVREGYDHIWDCCCDHGLLGFQLLAHGKGECVHFVDVVAPLMEEITCKLTRFYSGDKHWQVHCLDVATLPIKAFNNDRHLIIIAGIGGHLLIDLLEKILPQVQQSNVEFILSPVHHNYQLRHFLKENDCALIDEFIVAENKRFYEVLHISNGSGAPVSLVGDKMWDFANSEHRTYLQQTISHYQRMAKNSNSKASEIISAYQAIARL